MKLWEVNLAGGGADFACRDGRCLDDLLGEHDRRQREVVSVAMVEAPGEACCMCGATE